MTTGSDLPDPSSSSDNDLHHLTPQEQILRQKHWDSFTQFLRERGKNPKKNVGYAESSINPIARRVAQAHQHTRNKQMSSIRLTVDHADLFIESLNEDSFQKQDGSNYTEGSKRKFSSALEAYFRFRNIEWEPEIVFTDNPRDNGADPFLRAEREQLFKAAIEYQSPPTYKNVAPEERDRWNAQLAQYLGRPKVEIGPDDWQELQQLWKLPSLISVALDCGCRAEMINRLEVGQINLKTRRLTTPPEKAVKNDTSWDNELTDRSVTCLKEWFKQRSNRPKYDDSNHVWLTRESNPYNSHTLNPLLRNLMDEGGIQPNDRKLSWHSIRHSTGSYLYNQHKDLAIVAEILRQNTLEAARRYAHPLPETKKEAIEALQGGGL